MEVWRPRVDHQGSGELLEGMNGVLRPWQDAQNKGPWGADSRNLQDTQGSVSVIRGSSTL